ncbi:hypothetical protein XH98_06895 [Bradyrhizobium sp. CCBAU 51745]|nr:hypothetical protein [Bradyrhizobium sp. CCBAU 51745]
MQRRGRPLRHRLDKLPQAIHSFAPPRLQLAGVFRQLRTKLLPVNVGALSEQTVRIGCERKIAMAAQLGVCFIQYFHFEPRFTASFQIFAPSNVSTIAGEWFVSVQNDAGGDHSGQLGLVVGI